MADNVASVVNIDPNRCMTSHRLLERLAELAPQVRQHSAPAERSARLPPELVQGIIERDLFRLWVPRSCGGHELSLPDALRIHAAAARLDGALGWTVMIGAGGGLFAAWLEQDVAREIFGRPESVVAGSGAPSGRAERVAGGYRVSGRWRYASGAYHASVFTANCVVTEGGTPLEDAEGRPLVRAMAFEPSQVRIVAAWDTSGMRATGSEDFTVEDVFVPGHRSFSLAEPPRERGPLYRLPFEVLTELPVAAVGVGIARHALDAFASLAHGKARNGAPLARDPLVRQRFAESAARVKLAEAGLGRLADEAWQAACDERTLTPVERATITAGAATIVETMRGAVDALAALAGMNAIQQDDELARAWRDLQALGAHASVSPINLTAAGAALLGGSVETSG